MARSFKLARPGDAGATFTIVRFSRSAGLHRRRPISPLPSIVEDETALGEHERDQAILRLGEALKDVLPGKQPYVEVTELERCDSFNRRVDELAVDAARSESAGQRQRLRSIWRQRRASLASWGNWNSSGGSSSVSSLVDAGKRGLKKFMGYWRPIGSDDRDEDTGRRAAVAEARTDKPANGKAMANPSSEGGDKVKGKRKMSVMLDDDTDDYVGRMQGGVMPMPGRSAYRCRPINGDGCGMEMEM